VVTGLRAPRPGEPELRLRRLAVVASALFVLALFVAVFPTRTWLDQRASLASASRQLNTVERQDQVLSNQVRRLQTESEVERLARRDYGLVMPGEQAYAILPPAGAPSRPGVWTGGQAVWAGASPLQAGLGQAERPLGQRPPPVSAPSGSPVRSAGRNGLWNRVLADLAFWH